MAGKKNYLAQNIKSLRIAYGESQMDLAFAIGLNSPAAISNYENGTRSPKPEVRKKIALHYRITEEQLVHVDLSGVRNTSFDVIGNKTKMEEIALIAYPILCTDSDMKNTFFAESYKAHKRIIQCISSGQEPNDHDFDICFDSYDKAFEEDSIPEAAGNKLWWLLQLERIILNKRITEGAQQLMETKISGEEFLQRYYLRNFEFGDTEEPEDIEDKDFYNDLEEMILELLSRLKSFEYIDLVYYYIAIRYTLGMIKNENSAEMNQAIGIEMLWSFKELGNPYAKAYLQATSRATRKSF